MRKLLTTARRFSAHRTLFVTALFTAAAVSAVGAAPPAGIDPTPAPVVTGTAAPAASPVPAPPDGEKGGLHLTLTNTVRYEAAIRLKSQSPLLIGQPAYINENDGDRAFNAGQLINNRADLLSELDVAGKHYGARVSGSAWYDAAYNANNSISSGSMVVLHIGVKVATLPVIALGVGIGVDYSLYVMSMLLARLRDGMSLSAAYYSALLFTGRVVLLTGVTLAIGVGTWFFSPIKFQADMGVLLAFMFIVNMIGAVVLLPALAFFFLKPRPSGTIRPEPALPVPTIEPSRV